MPARLPANPEHIEAPEDLEALLGAAGFAAVVSVGRNDGAPLTDADRKLLAQLIEGYDLGRELNPSEAEMTAAVHRAVTRGKPLAPTGTGGE